MFRAHRTKYDEKPFFCRIYAIVKEKMVHVMIGRYFFKGFEGFSDLEAITDSRLKCTSCFPFRLCTRGVRLVPVKVLFRRNFLAKLSSFLYTSSITIILQSKKKSNKSSVSKWRSILI